MIEDELREATRALLTGGFVDGPAATLVRRHRRELAELLREELGWSVIADDHGPVRALCRPGAGHVPRGLETRSGRPFDNRRYALLFLVLASLEGAGARTTLTVLFGDVCERAGGIETLDFDRNLAAHRRAFVHAVQAACDLGLLELADGGEESFVSSGEGDALYRVDRTRLVRLLATSKPPSLASTPAAAVAENLYTDTDEGQLRRRRHWVTRALTCEPVVYHDDLSEPEAQYATNQSDRLRRLLASRFGLTLETRAEGFVAVDAEGSLSDYAFPAYSAPKAAAIAVLDGSRDRRDGQGRARWSTADLEQLVSGLGSRITNWSLDPHDEDAVARTVLDTVEVLVAMRLAHRVEGAIEVLPAAGRFALASPSEIGSADPLELERAP